MNIPEKEKEILRFWKENDIFQKSLEKRKKGKPFVFYEGPPTANARPGIHHVLARSFKDVILRYKTMQGFFVPRRAGWDTHGLPVELEVEKELGLNSKKDIEAYGIEKFTKKAKENIWRYKKEWEELTERMGFWLDMEHPYITYETGYIESLWFIIKSLYEKGFFYEDFRVSPWCYRCGTVLSSHELAQGYKKVKDTALFAKFQITNSKSQANTKYQIPNTKCYILSWTTTPWTLPGNVGLAVGDDIEYSIVKDKASGEAYILASATLGILKDEYEVVGTLKGKDLVGLSYEPLFDVPELQSEKSYKIYAADFVNTDEGTGVVHTAVMYGEDDYKLGSEVGLPKFHTVTEEGKFIDALGEGLGGMRVKAKETEEKIISHLKEKNLLFAREEYEHEYPHCWRCKNPLLYYATKSWFVKTTAVKEKLIENNEKINWIPSHLKEGRFGNFLREVKDWAFSRRRYWGTPLPIWRCQGCGDIEVVGSLEELQERAIGNENEFFFVRHGESENNILNIVSCFPEKKEYELTDEGSKQAQKAAALLKKERIDIIFSSPVLRAKTTAQIISKATSAEVFVDNELREIDCGPFNGKSTKEYIVDWGSKEQRFTKMPREGMENLHDVRTRALNALKRINSSYQKKRIAIVSHQDVLWVLEGALRGFSDKEIIQDLPDDFANGEVREMKFPNLPFSGEGEIDLHRPFIDEVKFECKKCKGEMRRVEEIADVWFDSGAMPFASAQAKNSKRKTKNFPFPADYICEAIDQTRGWFYTLLVTSTLLGFESPYKNVISLGHLLDEKGRKMSKSLGNTVNPFEAGEQYGMDAIRWYFFVVNPPGFYKRFDPKEIYSHQRGFLLTLFNCANFLKLYQTSSEEVKTFIMRFEKNPPENSLDRWALSRLHETIRDVTTALDSYDITQAARKLEEFTSDLSTWYIRRSRERIKTSREVTAILHIVISAIARLMAPFVPFSAEIIQKECLADFDNVESVHLADWPQAKENFIDPKLHELMREARNDVNIMLAKRAQAGVKVRQIVTGATTLIAYPQDINEIIAQEVNVKYVHTGKNVDIDLTRTKEMIEEGFVREVIRQVQDLRKIQGLLAANKIELLFHTDSQEIRGIIEVKKTALQDAVGAKNIRFDSDVEQGKTLSFEDKGTIMIHIVPIA